jgi:polyisoprenoid-binding protein YceI
MIPRGLLACLIPAGLLFAAKPAAAEERTLQLDPERSTIEVQVHATFDSFAGKLTKFQADIAVDPRDQRTTRARINFSFADLQTGRERRNRDMLAWSENERFPTVEFHLASMEPGVNGPFLVHGDLRLHGITHATTFPVSYLVDGTLHAFDGEVVIDYRDYGLPIIRKFYLLTVDPTLRIRFHLQGRLADPQAPAPAPATGGAWHE